MKPKHLGAALIALLACATAALAQAPNRGPGGPPGGAQGQSPGRNGPAAPASNLAPLPADSTTQQSIDLPGRSIKFTATAGTIRLFDADKGEPLADVADIAFRKVDADPKTRPVAFAFNGGPGSASGWLNLGALGPWRVPMSGDAVRPSAPPELVDNADTWLDFTDLVFIDPPGTGYSRVIGGDDVRKALWSVGGDVSAAATFIRRWTEANNRMMSPKYIVGESYGGIRAPKVASQLQTDQGVGINGVVLVSPAMNYNGLFADNSVMGVAGRLPTMAAARRERAGPIARADMRDVEDYASGALIADLTKGVNDKDAVARVIAKVAEFTGLGPGFVSRLAGRVPLAAFAREFWRDDGKVGSRYDVSLPGLDPEPFDPSSDAPDQLAAGMNAPIVEAMIDMYHNRLRWVVENGRYIFANQQAPRQWDYGRRPPESITDLRKILALDPGMRVMIAQGLTDSVVPYFMNKLMLDQVPLNGPPNRLRFNVYPGGHMMYARDASRAALRADAQALFEGK